MRYREIINEARIKVLYHGTSLAALLHIVHGDNVIGNGDDGNFSLSRSLEMAKIFAERQSDSVRENYYDYETHDLNEDDDLSEVPYIANVKTDNLGAVMVFDRSGLVKRFGKRLRRINPGQTFQWGDQWYDEQEEAFDVNGEETEIMQFCIGVIPLNPQGFAQFEALVLQVKPEFKPAFDHINRLLSR